MSNSPKVYQAITAVMAHMAKEGISKGRRNTQQGYQFRGIDDVYAALCGVLADNKLMMLPFVQTIAREERTTKTGGSINYTILTVDFKLVSSEDGTSDVVRMVGEAMDSADKSSNKAQSAALKYAALQVFMIPTEGDNDADATTHEVVAPRSPARVAGEASLIMCRSVADYDDWGAKNKPAVEKMTKEDRAHLMDMWKRGRADAVTAEKPPSTDFNPEDVFPGDRS